MGDIQGRFGARARRLLPYLALLAVIVGFINFFWFLAESARLGDGLNGYQREGHYFLGSHGRYTEVSQAAWEWSRIHGISVFVTHPLALAGGAYLLIRFVFPAMMTGRTAATGTNDRAQSIRGSGALLASARSAGQLGEVRFSGPLLNVSVFPGGIVVKPVFMREQAFLASEIRRVSERRSVFGRGIKIEHAGVDSLSPLILFMSPQSPMAQTIWRFQGSASSAGTGEAPTAAQPIRPRQASMLRLMGVAGIASGVVLIGVGVIWAIPTFGLFGILWTGWAIAILLMNVRRYLRRGF